MIEQDLLLLDKCRGLWRLMSKRQRDIWTGCWDWTYVQRNLLTARQLRQLERIFYGIRKATAQ